MKPAGRPQRRTGLRRAPLLRRRPQPGTGAYARPRKPTRTGEHRARQLVRARSGGRCEVALPGCHGPAASWHHRRNRSQGGTWCPANGLATCGSGTTGCHGALTNTNGRRADYERNGWIVPSHQRPDQTKALIAGQWWLLTAGGQKVPAP